VPRPSVLCDVISVVTEFMVRGQSSVPRPSVLCDVISGVTRVHGQRSELCAKAFSVV
jgi:hypothetical protein